MAPVRRPTLADIARRTGVSVATVSLALNGSPMVAAETAKRVRQEAKALNYRPNALARRLVIGRSEVISLYVVGDGSQQAGWIPPSSWMFYNPILKGANQTLAAKKYHLQFEIFGGEAAHEMRLEDIIMQHIQEGATDGVLLVCLSPQTPRFAKTLQRASVPVVTINHQVSTAFSSVKIDNLQGAKEAVGHLVSLGHRRIAHIGGPQDSVDARDRLQGYLESMAKAGLEVPNLYTSVGDWQIQSGYYFTRELMLSLQPPTAIFCANDHMAVGAMEALQDLKVDVPHQVSVVGFDDAEVSRVVKPRLTTVHQPLEQLGHLAAAEVLRQKESTQTGVKHTVILPTLIIRGSSTDLVLKESTQTSSFLG